MSDFLKLQALRVKAVEYAERFTGKPYFWSGDDPILGFDCSGFISEVLMSVGLIDYRHTADGLYQRFKSKAIAKQTAGCLVFWLTGSKATHVELAIDEDLTIGASGGGSETDTLEEAIRTNAFIKQRPTGPRGGGRPWLFVDPFKYEGS